MLNLSIMPLDPNHVEEICQDIITSERDGVYTHALFIMQFAPPEGNPPANKAEIQCQIYDKYRERLEKENAKFGVLVQSSLGHLVKPVNKHPFQNVVSLVDGSERESTCCSYDPNFREYMKGQMKILATRHPSIVMIDDDAGILYRPQKGCACKRHLEEFNRIAKTNLSREELYACTLGKTEEDKRLTDIYVQLQIQTMEDFVKAMREGLDEIDPTIQGVVSGIHTGRFCEFSDRIALAFAGKNNPKIVRMNNGVYSIGEPRLFTISMLRAAMIREYLKGKVDMLIAEGDTCPHNRYSTSAMLLHSQYVGSILEGAKGAKLWITRLSANEPNAGKAYRKILAKNSKFYEKLMDYYDDFTPVGCRIPISLVQDYNFESKPHKFSAWTTRVLERLGLPLYFSNDFGGAVFLDDNAPSKFTIEELKKFFKGTVVLSAPCAKQLNENGFLELTGVEISDWDGKTVHYDLIDGHRVSPVTGLQRLTPINDSVEELSHVVCRLPNGEVEKLGVSVSGYENPLGGYTVVYGGTPDTWWNYSTAFSLLCESRKNQFIKILKRQNNLPVYYPGDVDMYLRAGYLTSGELMVACFNLSLDVLDEIPLVVDKKVNSIEILTSNGERESLNFYEKDGVVYIEQSIGVLDPKILFIS